MKTIRKHMEPLVLLFSISLFFQSCVLYEKSPVSLEWAATQNRKAKVTTTDKQTYKFKTIRLENDHYYGIKDTKGEIIKTPLQADNLKKIHLQNKGASTVGTIVTAIGCVVAVILVWYFIDTGGGDWINLSE
ncbi:hypothetical protein [Aestuariivivens sediminis]|uniref:hypothetical protein n=1 Tax=Aestuariivivens sediminis TaxID=2913557 RepID=UPI001F55EE26|nr:hypothetical protein [Aestuariivivens sediminis]